MKTEKRILLGELPTPFISSESFNWQQHLCSFWSTLFYTQHWYWSMRRRRNGADEACEHGSHMGKCWTLLSLLSACFYSTVTLLQLEVYTNTVKLVFAVRSTQPDEFLGFQHLGWWEGAGEFCIIPFLCGGSPTGSSEGNLSCLIILLLLKNNLNHFISYHPWLIN